MAPARIDLVRSDSDRFVTSVTVIRVRRRRELLAGLRHWHRIRRQMRTLSVQPIVVRRSVSMRTRELTFFSLWPDVRSLLHFNGLGRHVEAVRWVIRGRYQTWTGIFGTVGRSELSRDRDSGEPHWLEAFDARASTRAGTARRSSEEGSA